MFVLFSTSDVAQVALAKTLDETALIKEDLSDPLRLHRFALVVELSVNNEFSDVKLSNIFVKIFLYVLLIYLESIVSRGIESRLD